MAKTRQNLKKRAVLPVDALVEGAISFGGTFTDEHVGRFDMLVFIIGKKFLV